MGAAAPKYKSAGSLSIHEGMRRWTSVPVQSTFLLKILHKLTGLLGLPLTNSHNARSAKLDFFIPHAGVLQWVLCIHDFLYSVNPQNCSGLAGYFEAVLYGNIGLSIHPHRKDRISKDMLSWFPLFFPFKVSSRQCFLSPINEVLFRSQCTSRAILN
jgi:hypothetical protein